MGHIWVSMSIVASFFVYFIVGGIVKHITETVLNWATDGPKDGASVLAGIFWPIVLPFILPGVVLGKKHNKDMGKMADKCMELEEQKKTLEWRVKELEEMVAEWESNGLTIVSQTHYLAVKEAMSKWEKDIPVTERA